MAQPFVWSHLPWGASLSRLDMNKFFPHETQPQHMAFCKLATANGTSDRRERAEAADAAEIGVAKSTVSRVLR